MKPARASSGMNVSFTWDEIHHILTARGPAVARICAPGGEEYVTAAAHHQAGTILRRFHDAEPPRPLPGYRDWLRDRAAYWTARARPFLSAADLGNTSAHLAAHQQAADPDGVPCHLDFQPRNWLLGPAADRYLVGDPF